MDTEKKALRQSIRQQRRTLMPTEADAIAASRTLVEKLEAHPRFREAESVALYWSLPDEPHTHELLERVFRQKRVYLPVVRGDDMHLCRFCGRSEMRLGDFNILEPNGERLEDVRSLPLIVVPGVAFDDDLYRLGRGRGYYDRFLSRTDAFRLGICFPFQRVTSVPRDAWDLPMNDIIS